MSIFSYVWFYKNGLILCILFCGCFYIFLYLFITGLCHSVLMPSETFSAFCMLFSLLPYDLLRAVLCFVSFAFMAEKCRPCLAVFSTQWTCSACVLSCVQVFATPWSAAGQSPLPKGLSKQQYWSGLPLSPPEGLPDSGIEPLSLALAAGFFNVEPPGKSKYSVGIINLFEYLVLRGGE